MILLLGATGYIGQAFADELRRRQCEFVGLSRGAIDYTRFDVLFNYVRKTKPELVINAAGYTGRPDNSACELARAETVQANTLLPQTMTRVCYLTKTPWGHVSSGGIYSGAKVRRNGEMRVESDLSVPALRSLFEREPERFKGFIETDEPNCSFRRPPCSFYHGTKALAEEALRWFKEGYVWRPQLVFDETDHPRNFLSTLQKSPKLPHAVTSLSHRGDFVRACLDMWAQHAPFGTYNVVNPGALSTGQIIDAIRRKLPSDQSSELRSNEAGARAPSSRMQAASPRSNCILEAEKLSSLGVVLRTAHAAVEDSLKNWRPEEPDRFSNSLRNSPAAKQQL